MYSQERVDGRRKNEIRPPCVTFGLLGRSVGSCKFQLGDSIAVASVTGPIEAKTQFSSHLGMYFDVSVRPNTGMATSRDRLFESQITTLLKSCVDFARLPYTQLTVAVEISSDDGSISSVIANAAVLAVMDAGVAMKYLPLSICLALRRDGETILDPDTLEEAQAAALVCQSVNLLSGEIVQTSGSGLVDAFACMALAQAAASSLDTVVRRSLEAHLAPLLTR